MKNKRLAKTIAVVIWEVFAMSMIIIYYPLIESSPTAFILLGLAPSAPIYVLLAWMLIKDWLEWVIG